jgi:superfamily II DNA or RNA helicase
MNLSTVPLLDRYKTYVGPEPIANFFGPCFQNSNKYDRAVGYFTSRGVQELKNGLRKFTGNGGYIRLVTSTRLEPDDLEEIRLGYSLREKVQEAFHRTLKTLEDGEASEDTLGYIGKLIKDKVLDIKIAIFKNDENTLYHEKIGFFSDESGNLVYFIGSNNETRGGLISNGESFEVLKSWASDSDNRRVTTAHQDFERLWSGAIETLEVLEISEVSKELFERHAVAFEERERSRELSQAPETSPDSDQLDPVTPIDDEQQLPVKPFALRPYQQEAIDAWLNNGGRGVLAMATGTGKTVTAIGAFEQLVEMQADNQPLLILITCPFDNLVRQWDEALRAKGYKPVPCFVDRNIWFVDAHNVINNLLLNRRGVGILITTHATFAREDLRRLIETWQGNFLIISDEVHHMGSRSRRDILPDHKTHTLGLSATPTRKNDVVGTQAIFSYYGDVVYDLPLRKAIEMGFLSPYLYFPVAVYLSDDEFTEYTRLSQRIAQLSSPNDGALDFDENPELYKAIRARNAALGNCESKLGAFKSEVLQRLEDNFQLVYCSEGKSDLQSEKQLTEVMRILGIELDLLARKYTSETPKHSRREILEDLLNGDLKFVVSMRCLDEGVDIPDARFAYLLASSSDERQWVQRRGRILRLPRDGEPKLAQIIDFVTFPPYGSSTNIALKLVRDELMRVKEFGSDSTNPELADKFSRDLEKEFGV